LAQGEVQQKAAGTAGQKAAAYKEYRSGLVQLESACRGWQGILPVEEGDFL